VACSKPTDTGCLRLMRRCGLQRPWLANGRARASVATAANSCSLGCMQATVRDFLSAYHKVTAMLWELRAATFCPKELGSVLGSAGACDSKGGEKEHAPLR
jgi:hypothetical protein